jgi:hypothetical protein
MNTKKVHAYSIESDIDMSTFSKNVKLFYSIKYNNLTKSLNSIIKFLYKEVDCITICSDDEGKADKIHDLVDDILIFTGNLETVTDIVHDDEMEDTNFVIDFFLWKFADEYINCDNVLVLDTDFEYSKKIFEEIVNEFCEYNIYVDDELRNFYCSMHTG